MIINFEELNKPDFIIKKHDDNMCLEISNYSTLSDFETVMDSYIVKKLEIISDESNERYRDEREVYPKQQQRICDLITRRNILAFNKSLCEFASLMKTDGVYQSSLEKYNDSVDEFLNSLFGNGIYEFQKDNSIYTELNSYILNIYYSFFSNEQNEYNQINEQNEYNRGRRNPKHRFKWNIMINNYSNALNEIEKSILDEIGDIQ